MEIIARLELEELEEFRRIETEMRVLESGQGESLMGAGMRYRRLEPRLLDQDV